MKIGGSTTLVSGGSSGLGNACARRLMESGGRVILLDIVLPKDDILKAFEGRCCYVRADVTSDSDVRSAIETGESQCGPINATVVCAGILHSERSLGKTGAASLDAFRRVIEVNLIGTFNVVRLCAESIAKRLPQGPSNERGVIVMTSSVAAFDGQTGQSAYSASKGAVASMTLPLARDLGRVGIRVVSIAPGVFETPMMAVAPDAIRQSLLDQSAFPMRFGEPHEFASAVAHVMENEMFNGCTIRLDAGLRMPIR